MLIYILRFFNEISSLIDFLNTKDSKSVLIFPIALEVVELLAILCVFHKTKVEKHILSPSCHLAADAGRQQMILPNYFNLPICSLTLFK